MESKPAPKTLLFPFSKAPAGKPVITSFFLGRVRRLQYTFDDKTEMIEEYEVKGHELLIRKWKKPHDFRESDWLYEVGEPAKPEKEKEDMVIVSSSANPIFIRKDTEKEFQFRVRNLKDPESNYRVRVDEDTDCIIISTENKKYYKKFEIPDMKRHGKVLKAGEVKWTFKNETLVISYPKHESVLQQEVALRKEFEKMNAKAPREGDIECTYQ